MVTMGQIPRTHSVKRVIEYAVEESLNSGVKHVGTEHILIGLVREKDGTAGKLLAELGLTYTKVRETVGTFLIEELAQLNDATGTVLGQVWDLLLKRHDVRGADGIVTHVTLRDADAVAIDVLGESVTCTPRVAACLLAVQRDRKHLDPRLLIAVLSKAMLE
jgi:ATP-dependent Clp protease ATP-binding subunit ClpA